MLVLRLSVAGGLLMLSACGQKGALYLPEPTRAVVPVVSDGTATTQKDKESEETKPSAGTP
jgi:predicted small lipoprotein YifL